MMMMISQLQSNNEEKMRGDAQDAPAPLFHRVFHTMGITVHLTLTANDDEHADNLSRAAYDVFHAYDMTFSRFKPDSELVKLNEQAGEWITVSPLMLEIIKKCQTLSMRTSGAFDISAGGFLASKGYGLPQNYTLPSPAPTFRDITIDEAESRIRTTPRQVLEPAAIVKGIAIDKAGEALEREGIAAFMINAGGDILTRGDYPGGKAWNVAIQDPRNAQAIIATVPVHNGAIATSGTYIVFGEDWNHQVDMRVVSSPKEVVSLSIIADTAERADTLASLGMLFGFDEGWKTLSSEHVPFMFVTKDMVLHPNVLFSEHASFSLTVNVA